MKRRKKKKKRKKRFWLKKQEVFWKSINEFNQNKRHEFGSRKSMILVSPAPWRKIIRNQGAKYSSGGNFKKNNESALGGKTMNMHSKTGDGTLKYEKSAKEF